MFRRRYRPKLEWLQCAALGTSQLAVTNANTVAAPTFDVQQLTQPDYTKNQYGYIATAEIPPLREIIAQNRMLRLTRIVGDYPIQVYLSDKEASSVMAVNIAWGLFDVPIDQGSATALETAQYSATTQWNPFTPLGKSMKWIHLEYMLLAPGNSTDPYTGANNPMPASSMQVLPNGSKFDFKLRRRLAPGRVMLHGIWAYIDPAYQADPQTITILASMQCRILGGLGGQSSRRG